MDSFRKEDSFHEGDSSRKEAGDKLRREAGNLRKGAGNHRMVADGLRKGAGSLLAEGNAHCPRGGRESSVPGEPRLGAGLPGSWMLIAL